MGRDDLRSGGSASKRPGTKPASPRIALGWITVEKDGKGLVTKRSKPLSAHQRQQHLQQWARRLAGNPCAPASDSAPRETNEVLTSRAHSCVLAQSLPRSGQDVHCSDRAQERRRWRKRRRTQWAKRRIGRRRWRTWTQRQSQRGGVGWEFCPKAEVDLLTRARGGYDRGIRLCLWGRRAWATSSARQPGRMAQGGLFDWDVRQVPAPRRAAAPSNSAARLTLPA